MSDEPPPSPLRLRPRPRPESETPPATAAEGEEARLRLKPKLAAEPEAETIAEPAPVAEEPPIAEPPRLRPKLNLAPEPEPEPAAEPEPQPEPEPQAVTNEAPAEFLPEAENADEAPPPPMPEEGKIRLKIKLPGGGAQEVAPAEAEGDSALPPFPVVAPPSVEGQVEEPPLIGTEAPPLPPRTPGLLVTAPPFSGSRPAVFKRARVPAALVAAERRKRMVKYFAIAIGGLGLAVVVISTAIKLNPPPPARVLPPRPVVVPPVEVKKIPVPEKVPVTVEPQPIEPSATERVSTTATVELAPGVTATTESIKAVPNATPAFRTFVASAKISGVYQGTPARAFINGRLVRAGEIVDEMMEIQFDSVDQATRSIVFKDSTGATVSRRY